MEYLTSFPYTVCSQLWATMSALTGYGRPCFAPRNLPEFDIDGETGFVPPRPLPKLQGEYQIWEDTLRDAAGRLSLGCDDSEEAISRRAYGKSWRQKVDSWPVLDTSAFGLKEQQRAHYVLAFILHYYAHSIPDDDMDKCSPIHIPKSLAKPLVAVSRALRIAPVLTYADTIIWNLELINPDGPTTPDNLQNETLYSETEDESAFYMSQVNCELRGAELLTCMQELSQMTAEDAKNPDNLPCISCMLTRLKLVIEDLDKLIKGVRPHCDPHLFYWKIRPWFIGSTKEHPWIFEGEEPGSDLLGPSGGQSTLMHAIDVWLDVDHMLRYKRVPEPCDANKRADLGFMRRMWRYMPGVHRDFLEYLEVAPVRLRNLAKEVPALREPYDAAVMAMKRLRDAHIGIAVLYVVSAAKELPPGCPLSMMAKAMEAKGPEGKSKGTGGSEVSTLLKAGRDATRRTMLKDNCN
ncbi:Indoleamine 2,3-dioxygenase [Schizophyllum commune]